jgi:ribonuclease HI
MKAMTENESKGWKRMSFKGNKVWVAVDESDMPVLENGKALIKYNLKQDYEYRVGLDSLKTDSPENLSPKGQKKPKPQSLPSLVLQDGMTEEDSHRELGVIHVFTDGASSGNPGPSGIGVLFRYGEHEREISRYIGQATNNIAELEAIRVALSEIKKPSLPVRLYSDSNYALGLLAKNHKAQKNQELVESIRTLIKQFQNLTFVKVEGHNGVEGNERADKLATSAIKNKTGDS